MKKNKYLVLLLFFLIMITGCKKTRLYKNDYKTVKVKNNKNWLQIKFFSDPEGKVLLKKRKYREIKYGSPYEMVISYNTLEKEKIQEFKIEKVKISYMKTGKTVFEKRNLESKKSQKLEDKFVAIYVFEGIEMNYEKTCINLEFKLIKTNGDVEKKKVEKNILKNYKEKIVFDFWWIMEGI